MAFKNSITLPTGDTGEYFKLSKFVIDMNTKELSAHFSLYKSQDVRNAGGQPQRPIIAKLRLQGDKFDQYFNKTAMVGKRHDEIIYAAVKAEGVISDYSAAIAAATDVYEAGQPS